MVGTVFVKNVEIRNKGSENKWRKKQLYAINVKKQWIL